MSAPVNQERNINSFYNLIRRQSGLRYGYQFLVKVMFDKLLFSERGEYSDNDRFMLQQLGFDSPDQIIDANTDPRTDLTFYAQATSLPGTTLDSTPVQYFAQGFRFPGIIKYDANWTIDILLDQQLTIYRQLRLWQEMMSSIIRNSGGNKVIPNAKGELRLLGPYGDDGSKASRIYAMEGIFPTQVPNIDFNYTDGTASIKTASVQFALQYFREITNNPNETQTFVESID